MKQNVDRIVEKYSEIYSQLRKRLKWHVTDERTLMMVAAIYVLKDAEFRLERFLHVSEYIKKNVGIFSSLKSGLRFNIAALLDIRFENPTEKFHEFQEIYEKLVAAGFRRGNYAHIAALGLLTKESDQQSHSHDETVERAMKIYRRMRQSHIFITGESDYPLAVQLAQVNRPVEEVMDTVDNYYQKLNQNGFSRGNDLQFLSHILSLQHEVTTETIIDRCVRLTDDFKQAGRRIKPMFYPAVGLMAIVCKATTTDIDHVMSLYKRLNGEKAFRWHKDLNFIMAANFFVKDQIDDESVLSTGIQTTIEAMIQAQQAAMIATMAGVTAATAANSSN